MGKDETIGPVVRIGPFVGIGLFGGTGPVVSLTNIYLVIYNESLAQGTIPDDWRQANEAPVFKKGEKYNAANYRPVSLTSICCKTLEHI